MFNTLLLKYLQRTSNKCGIKNSYVFQNFTSSKKYSSSYRSFQLKQSKTIGPFGWCLLIIPASTFVLGTWQVQRKRWKESLLLDLKTRTNTNPIPLPHSLEEIEDLEYYPVHVRGHFVHDEEMYLGPRSLMEHGDAATSSSLISHGQSQSNGYLVITPFKTTDGRTILVNRGWVSNKFKNPNTRLKGQVKGDVDVIGIIRLHENRPVFMPSNQPKSNYWMFRDLKQMAQVKGTDPIFLDATDDFNIEGGPIAGQTRISLRNEHLSYIFTWYSLCAVTSYMWYSQFLRKIKL